MQESIINLLEEETRLAVSSFQTILDKKYNSYCFEIDCSKLTDYYYSHDIRQSTDFKNIFNTVGSIHNPVLYWFEIASDSCTNLILDQLKEYKSAVNIRATPALKKNLVGGSRVLYVGKVKTGLEARLITHLGYLKGSGQTQGLQLHCWAADLGLKLNFKAVEFDKCLKDYMSIFEIAAAKRLNPIVGKHK